MRVPPYTAVVMILPASRFAGITTTWLIPARAAAAATALARFPVDAQDSVCRPSCRAADRATATTRSLKECVGLPVSSLTQSRRMPSARARLSARTSFVNPGFRPGISAMSSGTGSSAR